MKTLKAECKLIVLMQIFFIFSLSSLGGCQVLEPRSSDAAPVDPKSKKSAASDAAALVEANVTPSFTLSSITLSASAPIPVGSTVNVYVTLRNSESEVLELPSLAPSFSLTGSGTSVGTFNTPTWNSTEKRFESTFTGTNEGTLKDVLATVIFEDAEQAVSASLPTLQVIPVTGPTVELAIESARVGSNDFNVSATFSRDVTGLTEDDFTIVGASNVVLDSSSNPAILTITPSNIGNVSISLSSNKALDIYSLANLLSNQLVAQSNTLTINASKLNGSGSNSNPYSNTNYRLSGVCSLANENIYLALESDPANSLATVVCGSSLTWEYTAMGFNFASNGTKNIRATLGTTAAYANRNIDVDVANPSASVTSAPDLTYANQSAYTIGFQCADSYASYLGSASASVSVWDVGETTHVVSETTTCHSAGSSQNVVFNLSPHLTTLGAAFVVKVQVIDAAGHIGNTSTTANYSTSEDVPAVSLTSYPASVGQYSGYSAPYSFSGACSNIGGDVLITLGGIQIVTTSCSAGTFDTSLSPNSYPAEGSQTLLASQCNLQNGAVCGNSSVTITVDNVDENTVAPILGWTTYPLYMGQYVAYPDNINNYTVTGTCSSYGGDVTVSVGGTSVGYTGCSGQTFSLNFYISSWPADGSADLTASQCNSMNSGICGVVTNTVTIDNYDETINATPSLSFTSNPSSIGQYSGNGWSGYVNIGGNCSDFGSTITINFNGSSIGSASCSGGTFYASSLYIYSLPSDGTYNFNLYQCNSQNGGLCGSTDASVTVDHYDDLSCSTSYWSDPVPNSWEVSQGSCQSYSYGDSTQCTYQSGNSYPNGSNSYSSYVCNCSNYSNFSYANNQWSDGTYCYQDEYFDNYSSYENSGTCYTSYSSQTVNSGVIYSSGATMSGGSTCSP